MPQGRIVVSDGTVPNEGDGVYNFPRFESRSGRPLVSSLANPFQQRGSMEIYIYLHSVLPNTMGFHRQQTKVINTLNSLIIKARHTKTKKKERINQLKNNRGIPLVSVNISQARLTQQTIKGCIRAAINPVSISPASHRPAADARGKQHNLGAASFFKDFVNEAIRHYTLHITTAYINNDPNYNVYIII